MTTARPPLRGDGSPYTFFDLLSLLCFGIRSLPEERQEAVYRIFSAEYEEYYRRVRARFPFLAGGESRFPVYYYSLSPEHAARILEALASAQSDSQWADILSVIEAIDQLLVLEENLKKYLLDKRCPVEPPDAAEQGGAQVSQYYYRFDALNPATKAYGLILPQESCRWRRTSGRSMDSVAFHPLSVMRNYTWVRPDFNYRIVNLYADFQLSSGQRLKLVTSPLAAQAPFLLHCKKESRTFEIEYLDESAPAVESRLKKVFDIAVQEQAHIVMFPELMASPASIRWCEEYIRKNWQMRFPNLILLPTCEYARGQGWVNELTALDADGCRIFRYHKQHPFRLEKRRRDGTGGGTQEEPFGFFDEPIQADRVIYIVHVPHVGQIAFLICADVFRPGYLDDLTRQLRATLLLHVAFSPGEDLLGRMLATAKRDLCDVVLCNTCAAWDEAEKNPADRAPVRILDKRMVNIYLPYGHKYPDAPQSPLLTCAQPTCSGCAFVIEIAGQYSAHAPIPVIHRYE